GLTLSRSLVLFAAFGFGFLGFVDDLLGVAGDRGFRGHVRALAEGRLTTGFIKLFGGAGVAVVLVATPGFASGRRLITDAVLIALAANFANLLDLAPGRLIKVSWVLYIPLAVALGTDAIGVAIAPVMGAALALLPDDLRERLMLGDTGANVIGAVLGLGVVLGLGKEARTSILVVLIVRDVHTSTPHTSGFAAAFCSFTAVIWPCSTRLMDESSKYGTVRRSARHRRPGSSLMARLPAGRSCSASTAACSARL